MKIGFFDPTLTEYDDKLVEPVIREVESGKYDVFLSQFTLAEVLHTTRNIILADMVKDLETTDSYEIRKRTQGPEFRAVFESRCETAYQKTINFSAVNNPQVKVETKFSNYPPDLFMQATDILHGIRGDFKAYDLECKLCQGRDVACPSCGYKSDVRWKAVNVQDIIHVLIAKSFKCDFLITADKGFHELIPIARPVEVRVLQ